MADGYRYRVDTGVPYGHRLVTHYVDDADAVWSTIVNARIAGDATLFRITDWDTGECIEIRTHDPRRLTKSRDDARDDGLFGFLLDTFGFLPGMSDTEGT